MESRQPLLASRGSVGADAGGEEETFTVRRTAPNPEAVDGTESLDYHVICNAVQMRQRRAPSWFTSRSCLGVKPYTLAKLGVTISIGVTVGFLAVGLAIGTETIIDLKNATSRAIIHDGRPAGVLRAACFHVGLSMGMVLVGAALVQFWAPSAAGAGVSLVIAYLNGCAVPKLLSHENLAAKWVGTILGVGSNMALGPEAPMVHLGACVAHCYTHLACLLCSRWQHASRRLARLKAWPQGGTAAGGGAAAAANGQADGASEGAPDACETVISMFHNDADRREFICAGAAAGIAAAFGAPIGGVLFSMEEAATHWSRKVAWRCFLCTTVSVFTLAQLHPRWKNGVLSFQGVAELTNTEWFSQLPFIFLVSVGGGLLGALFNVLHERLFPFRAPRRSHWLRLGEVAGVAAATVACMFALAYSVGTCVDVPEWHEKGYGFTFYCTGGEYNDLATAFLANPDNTIRHIFSLGSLSPRAQVCRGENCYFTLRSLIILCPSYMLFMTLSAGIAIPGGLFMPSMLVGGSFGATCGLALMKLLPGWNIQPGLYAMIAATAMLGGVFRASISLVVLLVEGTQSTKFMLGIICAVICSNWVGDWILREGVYETDLDADGSVVFLRPQPPEPLFRKAVRAFMARPVWCLREVESVANVRHVLSATTHNGFPVLQAGAGDGWELPVPLPPGQLDSTRGGPLEGLILRSQLVVLLESRAFCDRSGRPLEPPSSEEALLKQQEALDHRMRLFYRSSVSNVHRRGAVLKAHLPNGHAAAAAAVEEPAQEAAAEAEGFEQTPSDPESLGCSQFLDLRPFMDRAPPTVRPETPGERAHVAFLSLGLRHLPVVDPQSRVLGIVTRKDLDHAAGFGPWRRNKQAVQAYALGSLGRLPQAGSSLARTILRSLTPNRTPSHSPAANALGEASDGGSSPGRRRPRSEPAQQQSPLAGSGRPPLWRQGSDFS